LQGGGSQRVQQLTSWIKQNERKLEEKKDPQKRTFVRVLEFSILMGQASGLARAKERNEILEESLSNEAGHLPSSSRCARHGTGPYHKMKWDGDALKIGLFNVGSGKIGS